MNRLSNNSMAVLLVMLMLVTIVGTTLVLLVTEPYYEKLSSSGKATGTIYLTVSGGNESNETTPSTPAPAGTGAGGGGGGGSVSRKSPVHRILDFRSKDLFFVDPFPGDSMDLLFSNETNITFKIDGVSRDTVNVKTGAFEFSLLRTRITYLDIDNNQIQDLKIEYDGTRLTLNGLFYEVEDVTTPIIPIISTQEIVEEEGIKLSRPKADVQSAVLMVVLLFIALLIFVLQHKRLSGLEKTHKKKLDNLIQEYNRKDKKVDKVLINKLDGQLRALEAGYRSGVISKKAYLTDKRKIIRLRNKGKR